jgi:hypothetical protein
MEVHHHPEVGKKSFKEYLLEGLMIFIAVTMGFFAESIRETIHEHHLERDYIKSFTEDLKIDTARINTALSRDAYILRKVDTLFARMLQVNITKSDIITIYKCQRYAMNQEDVHFSDRTYTQLKSTGDSRLIRSNEVSNAIQDYEAGMRDCTDQDAFYGAEIDRIADASKPVFLTRYWTTGYKIDSLVARGEDIRLATRDFALLNNYTNELGIFESVLEAYMHYLRTQKKSAVALMDLFQKEYGD